ncbi:ribonuclease III [Microvirga sp. CF3062]|uniref:ribonuclease III n=1 Tax=Microvirga sp. CF3062 TaxID=3110182 RepID=UPI002E770328|nr:ribonuclease III [Microvirga sp. CF3062]MEE1656409.1 ribonuclease III [Microvirga sp. CF3062]
MARRKPNLDELLNKLDYRFEKPELLDEALTHVSAPKADGQSYQRLEFLGDRVLGLAIAELLYRTFPGAPEGELSQRLAELVRRESCAEIAITWDVGPYLKLGAGEAHAGERRNQTILADVAEAIIGAVFMDGGYEAASGLVERAFQPLLEAPRRPLRDPKSALQEWAQGRGLPPPTYSIVEQTGPDHAPRFRVMVKVKGAETEFGLGTSKRIAEQAAARSLLMREGVWTEEEHGTA